VSTISLDWLNCTDRSISCAQFSEFEVMNADPKTAAYYVGVSQQALDVHTTGPLLMGAAVAYAIVVLGLAAHLVFTSGRPGWAAQEPAVSSVAGPAIDPEALTVGYRLAQEAGAGSGFVEFVGPPPEPESTIGSSQANESSEQHWIAAGTHTVMGE
jgi:hypothetical protein